MKLLYKPEEYNLTASATFLDVGSGFGKPVFHAGLQVGCLSHGIEVVPARVEFCIDFYYEHLKDLQETTGQALKGSSESAASSRKPSD